MIQVTADHSNSKAPMGPLSPMDESLQDGARQMLDQAVEAEVAE